VGLQNKQVHLRKYVAYESMIFFYFAHFYQMSGSAIFNRCDAKGRQVCRGSLGGKSKRSEKKSRNKKIYMI
jgi:hypothetical protein